jgi:glycosyltransferase involved in cell wall biosynthesis
VSQRLHVMVDALSSVSGGARTYLRAMLPRLGRADGVRVTVVCRADQREGFGLVPPPNGVTVVDIPSVVRPLSTRLATSLGVVPLLAARLDVDVLFCPTDHAPLVSPCPTVLMIRNPTPYVRDMHTVVSPGRRAREAAMRAVTLGSAWRAARTILVSHAALAATSAVIPLPKHRVVVVHHGRDGRFSPPPPGQARQTSTVLAVSSIYAFKNYPVLLDALVLLRDRHGVTPAVRIAGAAFDVQHAQWLKQRTLELGLGTQVTWLGEVQHAALVDEYRQATLFVMPSRLETFGHPYIESMACGTPGLVGDIACAREMCGDAVEYAGVDDAAAWAHKMDVLLKDEARRAALGEAGVKRAAVFGWDRCAQETLQVFFDAAGRGHHAPSAVAG